MMTLQKLLLYFLFVVSLPLSAQVTGGGERTMSTPSKPQSSKTPGDKYFSLDIGFSSPMGSTKNFDLDEPWHKAMGDANGLYFGFTHNRIIKRLNNETVGIGIYGQYGIQANSFNSKYKDYGYETELGDRVRIEYEIGPSLTFDINQSIRLLGYLKGGIGYSHATITNTNTYYDVDFGDNLGFYYGLGGKISLDRISLGIDINPGSKKFSGDVEEKLPSSYVRIILGVNLSKRK